MPVVNALLLVFCFIVPVLACRRSNIFLLNPMALLSIQVLAGVTIKGLLIIGSEQAFDSQLKYWIVTDVFFETIVYITLFILLTSTAYLFGKKHYKRTDLVMAMEAANAKPLYLKRAILFSVFVVVVSLGAYLTQKSSVVDIGSIFSFDGFHSLQRHRSVRIEGVDNFGATHAATSLFFKIGLFLFVVTSLMLFIYRNSGSDSLMNVKLARIAFIVSCVLILLEVLVTGRRTFLVIYVFLAIGINSMWSWRGVLSVRKVVLYSMISIGALSLFAFLTQSRMTNEIDSPFLSALSISIMGPLLYGEYFLSISKLTVIIDGLDNVGMLYGRSLLDWMGGLVPRVFWENKPVVSLGPYVRAEYYGYTSGISGIPPTIIGESFMNFGWLGLVFAPVIGYALRKFEDYCLHPRRVAERDGHIWYFILIFPISYNMYQSSFSNTMINVLSQSVLLVIFLRIVRGPRKRKSRQ